MFWRIFNRKISDALGLFNGHFIEAKALYALEFDAVSSVSFIGEIDTSKAYALILDTLSDEVVATYQHSYFDHGEVRMLFNNTIFLLRNKRIIELGNNWCQVLHTPQQHGWANDLISQLRHFRIVSSEPVIGFARQATVN